MARKEVEGFTPPRKQPLNFHALSLHVDTIHKQARICRLLLRLCQSVEQSMALKKATKSRAHVVLLPLPSPHLPQEQHACDQNKGRARDQRPSEDSRSMEGIVETPTKALGWTQRLWGGSGKGMALRHGLLPSSDHEGGGASRNPLFGV